MFGENFVQIWSAAKINNPYKRNAFVVLFVSTKKENKNRNSAGGVRTQADIRPLELKSNALTTRPPHLSAKTTVEAKVYKATQFTCIFSLLLRQRFSFKTKFALISKSQKN